jgi:CheY-like chemotaxis protein
MTFQALLVSKDDEAAAVLNPVLSGFGLTTVCCGYPDALCQLTEQKFDAVLVDFDDPHSAGLLLRNVHQSSAHNHTVTVALLSDKAKVRNVVGEGANFVLYKPLSQASAEASLRAAAALIKRERRGSFRVAVQAPIRLKLQDGPDVEGILLDLSETGMDVLAANPLCPASTINARFTLPGDSEIELRGEIAWANPNGQAGVHFVDLSDSQRSALKTWVAANAAELPPLDPEPLTQCKLTDLSLGGCYVETESPFPEHSAVTLTLKAEGLQVQSEGAVQVMHPGFGMGIEFPSNTSEGRAQVNGFIEFLTSRPGAMPELQITPRALSSGDKPAASAESGEGLNDPLLDLLHRGESLSQEEFLQELRQQRSSEVASA